MDPGTPIHPSSTNPSAVLKTPRRPLAGRAVELPNDGENTTLTRGLPAVAVDLVASEDTDARFSDVGVFRAPVDA